jgi:hypothetical protein
MQAARIHQNFYNLCHYLFNFKIFLFFKFSHHSNFVLTNFRKLKNSNFGVIIAEMVTKNACSMSFALFGMYSREYKQPSFQNLKDFFCSKSIV